MNSNIWLLTFADSIAIATTLILAALGALFTERSGVLNLGIEGIMLLGAMVGFTAEELAFRDEVRGFCRTALPPAIRERILVEYLNDLFRHRDA